MFFLVELDHVKSGPLTPGQGRTFIEQVIFPTLARAEQLAAEGKIVGGGAMPDRAALDCQSGFTPRGRSRHLQLADMAARRDSHHSLGGLPRAPSQCAGPAAGDGGRGGSLLF